MVSVYLDYANPKTAPEGWHACAQFCLAISNPSDPTIQTSSRESHGLTVSRIDSLLDQY
jgi:ubiquitin carboxyl-terminal hydrolase 7